MAKRILPKPNPNMSRPGNKHAAKLNTLERKRAAYQSYCDHLAKGKSKRSWCYEDPNGEFTFRWESMEKYIANDSDIDPEKKEIALTQGFYHWEEIVEATAKGTNKDGCVPAIQMVMRNKFGWDKEESHNRNQSKPLVEQLLSNWKK